MAAVDRLDEVLGLIGSGSAAALTGAGLSTDSGIPDYRGPGPPRRTPMDFTEFRSGVRAQQRYWARSHVGWPRMSAALPNDGHRALAELEAAGVVSAVITQNVDGLHRAAGSRNVIELHGRVAEVVCLDCGGHSARHGLQERLVAGNPGFLDRWGSAIQAAPDGDVALFDPAALAAFRVAGCTACGGRLKPDVVFFGENVPRERVEAAFELVDSAGVLLVAGSSLTVMSGLRFVRRARLRLGIPVVIVNRGPTRGDEFATLRIDGGCSEVLSALARAAAAAEQSPSRRRNVPLSSAL